MSSVPQFRLLKPTTAAAVGLHADHPTSRWLVQRLWEDPVWTA